jgi:trk system potassium uptake protein TrkH
VIPFTKAPSTRTSKRPALTPAKVITLSFLLAIAIGTLLLALPWSATDPVSLFDAFFTSASALCGTGMTVVDTATAWTPFGWTILMLLVQVGGLGIVTLSLLVALLLGRRVGFRTRLHAAEQVSALQPGNILPLVRAIFLVSLGFETLGALLLWPTFAALHGSGWGLFYAYFHAINAFNNAGFALYPDNLVRFINDPLVNLTTLGLILIGGFGFIVHLNIWAKLRTRQRTSLTLHTRIVLLTTLLLALFGSSMVLVIEWTNPHTLAPLPLGSKVLAGIFQGISPSTAGFNTLAYADLREETLLVTMVLMFIGGSPGSTAGGIKTVTAFVLFASAWSLVRGRGELKVFGRRVTIDTVVKAGSVALLSTGIVMGALVLLTITGTSHSCCWLSRLSQRSVRQG